MEPQRKPGELVTGFNLGDLIVIMMFTSMAAVGIYMAFKEASRRRAMP